MNQKTLIILGSVAVVLAIIAAVSSLSRKGPTQVTTPDEHLIPGLLDQANNVQRVVVRTSSESVALSRIGDQWVVEEKDNYPARFETVRTLVLEIANLRKQESRTSNPDLYPRIEVEDVTDPNARSRQVDIFGENGRLLASVIVGSQRFSQTGGSPTTFVRRSGEAQSWLARGGVNVNTSITNWMETQFLSIPSNNVQRIEVAHADGELVVINKPDPNQSNFILETLPEGREVTSPTRPNELAGILASLRFDDVRPAAFMEEEGEPEVVVTVEDRDGLRIVARAFAVGDSTWFRFSADVNEEKIAAVNEQRTREAADSVGEDEPTPPVVLIDIEEVRRRARELAPRFDGWAYRLPGWSRDRFYRRNDFYLKPLDSPSVNQDDEEWVTDVPPSFDIPEGVDMERLQQAINEMMNQQAVDLSTEGILESITEEEAAPLDPTELELIPVEP